MPLFQIFVPENTFTDEDKSQLAEALTQGGVDFLNFPRFYVNVLFHDMAARNMYIGGEARTDFVRVAVDAIARLLPTDEIRENLMTLVGEILAPFVKDRGLDWEVHFDETPKDLWRVNGLIAPESFSDEEKLWAKENRPIPY